MPPVLVAVAAAAASIGTATTLTGAVIFGVEIGATAASIFGGVVGMLVPPIGSPCFAKGPQLDGS